MHQLVAKNLRVFTALIGAVALWTLPGCSSEPGDSAPFSNEEVQLSITNQTDTTVDLLIEVHTQNGVDFCRGSECERIEESDVPNLQQTLQPGESISHVVPFRAVPSQLAGDRLDDDERVDYFILTLGWEKGGEPYEDSLTTLNRGEPWDRLGALNLTVLPTPDSLYFSYDTECEAQEFESEEFVPCEGPGGSPETDP